MMFRSPGAALLAASLAACATVQGPERSGAPLAAAPHAIWLGSDLSYVNEMEDCGAEYRDHGVAKDPYQLFADRGNRLVRLRLWHNPDWTDYSTLSDVKRAIRASKAAGMQVLLDIHYSDNWADPGDQVIPKAWEGLGEAELEKAVYDYTYSVISGLAAEGLMPDMVQVGNETNTEVMLPGNVPEDEPIDWERNARLLGAGLRAVGDAGAKAGQTPLRMLHIAQPENAEPWFDDAMAHGLTDFDIIGLSYYPKWSTRDMKGLADTILRIRHKYGKQVVVVETAYPFTLQNKDPAGNILGEDSLIPGYPATPGGQRRFMVDLTQAVLGADGSGVVYWEPAWVSTGCKTRWGTGSHWENAAYFDYRNTNATHGFDFLTHDYAQPVPVTFRFAPALGAAGPVWLWGSFMGARDFAVRLEPVDGAYTYEARLPAGTELTAQVYGDAAMSKPLLAEDARLVVGKGGAALTLSLPTN
ncbi:MAG TPA: glycosyl hydrolase 53 family protein [Hyphomonas sp.]|nr:glycosyl hydrolase 53 family protein [Hyphomonas sp.]